MRLIKRLKLFFPSQIHQNFTTSVVALFIVQASYAQDLDRVDHHKSDHFILVVEAQRMRSTHSQTIYGGSVFLGYSINRSFSAGIGGEVSYADSLYTHDKSATVFFFKPIPMYGEVRFISKWNSRFIPYAHLAVGMSSITYHLQRHEPTPGNVQHLNVYQRGFFVNAGFGLLFPISKRIAPSIGISLKGFHISKNPYEINPHGITIQAGIVLRPLRKR